MTEKQIKTKIDKLNNKLTKLIDKFVDNVEKASKDFKDLFPAMSDNDFHDKAELFKLNLQKCILTPKEDYDSIASEILDKEKNNKEKNNKEKNNKENDNTGKRNKIEIINIQ